jgi:hypothetical protein
MCLSKILLWLMTVKCGLIVSVFDSLMTWMCSFHLLSIWFPCLYLDRLPIFLQNKWKCPFHLSLNIFDHSCHNFFSISERQWQSIMTTKKLQENNGIKLIGKRNCMVFPILFFWVDPVQTGLTHLTRNPSNPWPDHLTGSMTGSGFKTMDVTRSTRQVQK